MYFCIYLLYFNICIFCISNCIFFVFVSINLFLFVFLFSYFCICISVFVFLSWRRWLHRTTGYWPVQGLALFRDCDHHRHLSQFGDHHRHLSQFRDHHRHLSQFHPFHHSIILVAFFCMWVHITFTCIAHIKSKFECMPFSAWFPATFDYKVFTIDDQCIYHQDSLSSKYFILVVLWSSQYSSLFSLLTNTTTPLDYSWQFHYQHLPSWEVFLRSSRYT